jgi:hypothetical protein
MNLHEARETILQIMDSLPQEQYDSKRRLWNVSNFLLKVETRMHELRDLLKVTEERAYGLGWGKGKDE